MRLGLDLNLGQQLTLSPLLQQAIKLLSLSQDELGSAIIAAAESNPMLELYYESKSSYTEHSSQFEQLTAVKPDLQAHLLWQVNLTNFSPKEQLIAEAIIDDLDEQGYLRSSLTELSYNLAKFTIAPEEITSVLYRIQLFDPIGIAARDLPECLQIQLNALQAENSLQELPIAQIKLAKLILKDHSTLLMHKRYLTIAQALNISEAELFPAIMLLSKLNPNPGNKFNNKSSSSQPPDLIVTRHANGQTWEVKLARLSEYKLNLNTEYLALLDHQRNTIDRKFLRQQLIQAKWFLNSLQHRERILYLVANSIVQRQQLFFSEGDQCLQRLTLQDIAQATGLHNSTVSRVTTQKYISSPQGLYELKYFFSSYSSTKNTKECSSIAIRAMIKKLICNESVDTPLSDSKIANLLAAQGINITRRTVTKYREMIAIPPSKQRKNIASPIK